MFLSDNGRLFRLFSGLDLIFQKDNCESCEYSKENGIKKLTDIGLLAFFGILDQEQFSKRTMDNEWFSWILALIDIHQSTSITNVLLIAVSDNRMNALIFIR